MEKTDITGLKVSTFWKQGSNIKLHQNLICVCVCVWRDVMSTFNTNILKTELTETCRSYALCSWSTDQCIYDTTQTYRQNIQW